MSGWARGRRSTGDDSPWWMARQTRSGVNGMSRCTTPYGRERVDDRVPHGGGRAGRARLADALRAERVPRRGRDRVRDLERRELGRARNRVVDEARGERVAAVVVDDLLEQRLRGALGDAAVHLRFGEHRVHDAAAVVDRDVPHQPHRARLGVDLDDRDVAAERERPVGVEVDLRLQPGRGRTGVLGRDRAISRHETADAGVPATPSRPSSNTTMSASAASSRFATSRRAVSSTAADASCTALPASCSEREPNVPTPCGTRSVSECTTRTSSNGMPSTDGRDLRPGRLVALTVRNAPRHDGRGPVGLDAHRSVLAPAPAHLDVAAESDPELHAITTRRAALLARARQLVVVAARERLVERALVFAGVVVAPVAVRYGNASGGMKLRRRTSTAIEVQHVREHVDRAFQQRGRFGTSGPAVRTRRRRVGERRCARRTRSPGSGRCPRP